jgi:hypothetical protein
MNAAALADHTTFIGEVSSIALRRKSTVVRIASTVGSSLVAYALAFGGGMYATCMLDLGCL